MPGPTRGSGPQQAEEELPRVPKGTGEEPTVSVRPSSMTNRTPASSIYSFSRPSSRPTRRFCRAFACTCTASTTWSSSASPRRRHWTSSWPPSWRQEHRPSCPPRCCGPCRSGAPRSPSEERGGRLITGPGGGSDPRAERHPPGGLRSSGGIHPTLSRRSRASTCNASHTIRV